MFYEDIRISLQKQTGQFSVAQVDTVLTELRELVALFEKRRAEADAPTPAPPAAKISAPAPGPEAAPPEAALAPEPAADTAAMLAPAPPASGTIDAAKTVKEVKKIKKKSY